MHKRRYLSASVIFIFLMTGCAIEPKIVVDFSEVGNSKIGTLIANNFYYSSKIIDNEINKIVNQSEGEGGQNIRERIESIGFQCEKIPSSVCNYSGSVKSKLVMVDGSVMPGNNIVEKFNVEIDFSKNPISIHTSKETLQSKVK